MTQTVEDPNLTQEYILKYKAFKRANKVRINKVNPKKTTKGILKTIKAMSSWIKKNKQFLFNRKKNIDRSFQTF